MKSFGYSWRVSTFTSNLVFDHPQLVWSCSVARCQRFSHLFVLIINSWCTTIHVECPARSSWGLLLISSLFLMVHRSSFQASCGYCQHDSRECRCQGTSRQYELHSSIASPPPSTEGGGPSFSSNCTPPQVVRQGPSSCISGTRTMDLC